MASRSSSRNAISWPDSVLPPGSPSPATRASNAYVGFGASLPAGRKKWELRVRWARLHYTRTHQPQHEPSPRSRARHADRRRSRSENNAHCVSNQAKDYFSLTQGVSAKYKIDSAGSEWTTDLSVTWAPSKTEPGVLHTVFQCYPSVGQLRKAAGRHRQPPAAFIRPKRNLVKKLPQQAHARRRPQGHRR
jgi:hypothetical protein